MIADMKIFPFIEREVLELAAATRAYLRRSRGCRDLRDVQLRFLVCERIEWVVAWVLYQKAVHAGEMTSARVRDELRDMALRTATPEAAMDERTDPALRALVERSGALFVRVQRLLQSVQPPARRDGHGGKIEWTLPDSLRPVGRPRGESSFPPLPPLHDPR